MRTDHSWHVGRTLGRTSPGPDRGPQSGRPGRRRGRWEAPVGALRGRRAHSPIVKDIPVAGRQPRPPGHFFPFPALRERRALPPLPLHCAPASPPAVADAAAFCKSRPPGSSPARFPPPLPLAAAVLSHGPPPSAPSRARAGLATRSAPSPLFTAPAGGAAPPTRPRVGLVCAGVDSAPPLRTCGTCLTAVRTLCAAAAPTQPSLARNTRPTAVRPIRSLRLLSSKSAAGYIPPRGIRPQGMETNQRSGPVSVTSFSYNLL